MARRSSACSLRKRSQDETSRVSPTAARMTLKASMFWRSPPGVRLPEPTIMVRWPSGYSKRATSGWTRKRGVSYYGYKNHISMDRESGLVRAWEVTDAAYHDSRVFEWVLDEWVLDEWVLDEHPLDVGLGQRDDVPRPHRQHRQHHQHDAGRAEEEDLRHRGQHLGMESSAENAPTISPSWMRNAARYCAGRYCTDSHPASTTSTVE